MEPKNKNQVVIIFSFLTLSLFNHVTQTISGDISPSSAPSPQQPPVFSAETDISASTPTANPPGTDILAPSPTANPPKADLSTPTQAPDPSQGVSKINLPDPPSPSLPPTSEIKHTCDLTDFPALCWPYIGSFYSGKSDVSSVLEMAINATVQQIKLAHSAVARLASDHPSLTSKKSPTLLDDCKEMYDDALDNLKSAMDAIPEHDTSTINIMLSAALTDITTCDDEFTGKNSPLGDIDSKLNKLLSNCLAIASLIKQ